MVGLFLIIANLIVPLLLKAGIEQDLCEIEYELGLYTMDLLKIVIGVFIIIGGFGFFMTSSARRAHWPLYIRRIFMGIFIFSNIFNQAVFTVLSIPTRKNIVCMIGKCMCKLRNIKGNYHEK